MTTETRNLLARFIHVVLHEFGLCNDIIDHVTSDVVAHSSQIMSMRHPGSEVMKTMAVMRVRAAFCLHLQAVTPGNEEVMSLALSYDITDQLWRFLSAGGGFIINTPEDVQMAEDQYRQFRQLA